MPPEPSLRLKPDPAYAFEALEFGELTYPIWVHEDIANAAHDNPAIIKRVGLVLQHLGVYGRTSIVKACRGNDNRGWLRSPLGGNSGMQYYLWWTRQGETPVKALDLPHWAILVRAIRHHDDHAPLDSDTADEYMPLCPKDIESEKYFGRLWTEQQLDFMRDDAPVRLLLGRPGAGKTTALWKALEARADQRVLYVTWSRELKERAEQHFRAFAPKDVRVDAYDFVTLLGELCGQDIPRLTLWDSIHRFSDSVRQLPPKKLGPWAGRERSLFAEIRAFLLGRAIPGDSDCFHGNGTVRLKDTAYLRMRGDNRGVGESAAKSLLDVHRVLERKPLSLWRRPAAPVENIFPELVAAQLAIDALRADRLPPGFADFDRVVVDEAQDLTLRETVVIVELCRAIARHRQFAPWLLLAADDGQTVRPTGFDWGRVNEVLGQRVARPREFHLDECLRCPRPIARVVERASEKYASLEKGRRPTNQRPQTLEGNDIEASIFHVEADTTKDAAHLLRALDGKDGVAIVSLDDEPPGWVPQDLREMVLRPAEVKGLEYQSVCVLDPGKELRKLDEALDEADVELAEQEHRTAIDRLRVALSRATETLAFVDTEPSEADRRCSQSLLGQAASVYPDDLLEHFAPQDAPLDERLFAWTDEARRLASERPRRAWTRVCRAMRSLQDWDVETDGRPSATVQHDVHLAVLELAARVLIDEVPEGVSRTEVQAVASQAVAALNSPADLRAFEAVDGWSTGRSASPFELLDSTLALGDTGNWLRAALAPVAQQLRRAIESGATDPTSARALVNDVESWLRLTGYAGDAGSEARRLRCFAFDTLLNDGDLESADLVLQRIEPEDHFRTGQLREAQELPQEAAAAYQRAGSTSDATRVWRNFGRWEEAFPLANGSEREDLHWLLDAAELFDRRPVGHHARLTDAEQRRLRELMA